MAVGGGVEVSGTKNTFPIGINGRFYEYMYYVFLLSKIR